MSKPRSKLFPYANHELRTVRGFTTAIHFGRQAKHLPGQPNFDSSKSMITRSIPELQGLLESKAGTGSWHGSNKEVIDFGVTIGHYHDSRTGANRPTTRGTVHYSNSGAHVVPASPAQTSRRKRKP